MLQNKVCWHCRPDSNMCPSSETRPALKLKAVIFCSIYVLGSVHLTVAHSLAIGFSLDIVDQ